VHTEMEGQ